MVRELGCFSECSFRTEKLIFLYSAFKFTLLHLLDIFDTAEVVLEEQARGVEMPKEKGDEVSNTRPRRWPPIHLLWK